MIETLSYPLPAGDLPTHWYNILPDFPEPLPPPLHPGTQQPLGPAELTAIFPGRTVPAGI